MGKSFLYHGIISKEEDRYCALCIELNVASEGATLEEAKGNLREAVEGYLEVAREEVNLEGLIPRRAPEDLIEEYRASFEKALEEQVPSEVYAYAEVVGA